MNQPPFVAGSRELNIRGHNEGHEQIKRAVLKVAAAMMVKGVQVGGPDSPTGLTRFVP